VFVLDVDGEKGRTSLATLEAKFGQLPTTLVSRTGREDSGEHWWFICPADCKMPSSTGKVGTGLDVRGEGGYAIVPPSIHETGRPYEWINPNTPVADAPDWLKPLAAEATLERDEGHIIPEGRRDTTLASIAGRMRRRGASEDEIRAELRTVNERDCLPPLPDDQICKIARSVARYDPAAKPDPLLPLRDYVRAAIDKNGLDFACRLKWLSPLFVFARKLKAREEFAASEGYRAAQTLDTVLEEVFGPPDPWEHVFGDISSDPRAEFIRTWDCVESSSDGDSLTIARASAQRFPLMPLRSYSSLYNEFISMAGHLQRSHLGQPVAIPVKRFGELLRCHHTMVCHYRRWAVDDGLLSKVAEYAAKQRAAEFTFAVDKFDWSTGEQYDSLSPEAPLPPESTLTRVPVPNSHQERPFSPSHGGSGVSGENAPDGIPTRAVQLKGTADGAMRHPEMQIDDEVVWL
jgi:hypothetical protein